MLVFFGILLLVFAGILAFFALQPDLAFFLDEGWKFRGNVEPSEAYKQVSTFGRGAVAVIAAIAGVSLICAGIMDKRSSDAKEAASRAASQLCEDVHNRLDSTIKWGADGTVTNHDEVQALGAQLGVEINIERWNPLGGTVEGIPPAEEVDVRDPATKQVLIMYQGGQLGARPIGTECERRDQISLFRPGRTSG